MSLRLAVNIIIVMIITIAIVSLIIIIVIVIVPLCHCDGDQSEDLSCRFVYLFIICLQVFKVKVSVVYCLPAAVGGPPINGPSVSH